ncbi:MAG: hypothetical protein HY401_05800 [Elusimicrobia bacterium]|nr:hypothetical protein [Elusimicrobiota bacterium]
MRKVLLVLLASVILDGCNFKLIKKDKKKEEIVFTEQDIDKFSDYVAARDLGLLSYAEKGFSAGESPLNPVVERGPASTRGEPSGLVLGSGGKGDSPALNPFYADQETPAQEPPVVSLDSLSATPVDTAPESLQPATVSNPEPSISILPPSPTTQEATPSVPADFFEIPIATAPVAEKPVEEPPAPIPSKLTASTEEQLKEKIEEEQRKETKKERRQKRQIQTSYRCKKYGICD